MLSTVPLALHLASSDEFHQHGLAQLPSVQPALIVTDYMMPVMTGGEMAKLVRSVAQFETLPIVMTSATAPEHVAAYSEYYDSFLRKPYRWDDLFAEISRLLSERRP